MRNKRRLFSSIGKFLLLISVVSWSSTTVAQSPAFKLEVEQLTTGPGHHLFGYIGQCQTIPWNASGRYILGLEVEAIDRMPEPGEAATIILIDTWNQKELLKIDQTYAWNPQQGTMFYWNPLAPETQFFFNDKDPETGDVFTVVYDIEKERRVRTYHFDDAPIGNGGVAADGSAWLGINYGRLARLRPVTGYPGAVDWSKEDKAPENDGIFIVDIKTGKKRLLVSYQQLDEELRKRNPGIEHPGLFINHTLWNRENDMVYFFLRAGWNGEGVKRTNIPCSIRKDGTDLVLHDIHIGGHPEWAEDNLVIGRRGKKQVLYDIVRQEVVGQLGNQELFPNPEGDIALSPDGNWFVNGYKKGSENYYTVYRRSDGAYARSDGFYKGKFSGDIRIDPAPRWNRANDAILIPGIDENNTRQMFVIYVND